MSVVDPHSFQRGSGFSSGYGSKNLMIKKCKITIWKFLYFFLFCGSFLPSWIQINADSDGLNLSELRLTQCRIPELEAAWRSPRSQGLEAEAGQIEQDKSPLQASPVNLHPELFMVIRIRRHIQRGLVRIQLKITK
jgi:hypothetical protein